ncbi:ABC-F family ATP-binding cassette domain-containing protein [Fluviispira vulneris]|uniref:ABC-F family ATP-binding cassette domain-containing protein n=1 Tax=Fluviispira vulneris TaxID=2763012 RepID=UPI00164588B5|nr:ABC-F family ATP-binding cassette domain-containing protein [Fluviispira vulneris]
MSSAPYLSCYNLSTSYGSTQLFNNLSFTVHPGERWGIVGPNGAGKSTLFRLITGTQDADTGSISIRNGIRVAIVNQKYSFDIEKTVEEILRDSLPEEYDLDLQIKKIEEEIDKHSLLAEENPDITSDLQWGEKLSDLNDKLINISGVGTDNVILSALKAGKLLSLRDRRFKNLSGGQQKCVQIVSALLKNPQLILLDEPTNHLDVQTVDWLEEFLLEVVEQGVGLFGFKPKNESTEPVAFVIISHDRALLDTLVNKILEIEAGESKQYDGNYEAYSQLKLENEIVEQKTRSKMANLMRRELAWLRTGAKARTTKQKSRIDRALALDKTLNAKNQKANLPKNAEMNFDALMTDEQRNNEDNIIPVVRNLGEQELVRFKNVSIKHPAAADDNHFVFQNLEFVIKPKMRIALLGPNGCGKSTLMNLVVNQIKPDLGEITYHELVKISHFDQQRQKLDPNETVRSTIAPEGEYVHFAGKYMHIMSYLDRFLFFKFDANRKVGELSGGEQARLLLAKLMLEQGNLLILDEPTNDLDISTLQVLEKNLCDFQGGVLFTSHDRYFVQRVATGLFTFLGEKNKNGIRTGEWLMLPDLDQALESMEKYKEIDPNKKPTEKAPLEVENKNANSQTKKAKLSFKEQRELDEIEKKIENLEANIEQLAQKLENAYANNLPYNETALISSEIQTKQSDLDLCYLKWEELSTKNS